MWQHVDASLKVGKPKMAGTAIISIPTRTSKTDVPRTLYALTKENISQNQGARSSRMRQKECDSTSVV